MSSKAFAYAAAAAILAAAAVGCSGTHTTASPAPAGAAHTVSGAPAAKNTSSTGNCNISLLRRATSAINDQKTSFSESLSGDGGPAIEGFSVGDDCYLVMKTNAAPGDDHAKQIMQSAGGTFTDVIPKEDGFAGVEITDASGATIYKKTIAP